MGWQTWFAPKCQSFIPKKKKLPAILGGGSIHMCFIFHPRNFWGRFFPIWRLAHMFHSNGWVGGKKNINHSMDFFQVLVKGGRYYIFHPNLRKNTTYIALPNLGGKKCYLPPWNHQLWSPQSTFVRFLKYHLWHYFQARGWDPGMDAGWFPVVHLPMVIIYKL